MGQGLLGDAAPTRHELAPALRLYRSPAVVGQGLLGDAAPTRHGRNTQSARCEKLIVAGVLDVGERCCS